MRAVASSENDSWRLRCRAADIFFAESQPGADAGQKLTRFSTTTVSGGTQIALRLQASPGFFLGSPKIERNVTSVAAEVVSRNLSVQPVIGQVCHWGSTSR